MKFLWTVSLLVANIAFGQEVPRDYNAEKMLQLCTGTSPDEDPKLQSMICTFRLQGASVILNENCRSIESGFAPAESLSSNSPPSQGAARQAFVNFMEDNPDNWGLPWHVAVSLAISRNFPCTN